MVISHIRNIFPEALQHILKTLQQHKFEAYVVGGCVRDMFLNKTPKDWDITTNALPEEVIKIFSTYKVIDIASEHGTIVVVLNDEQYEITTYRKDGEYKDNRHPEKVEFVSCLKEDLARRDFTINAMAYNEKVGLVDYFGGMQDLQNKIIRCVGDADKRFKEDALRMLRAIRFSAQLSFEIFEDSIFKAFHENKNLLSNLSMERIRDEFNKIILENPCMIHYLMATGFLDYFILEFKDCMNYNQNNPYHYYSLDNHIIFSMMNIEKDLILRLTMFFHDIAKPQCKTVDEKTGYYHFYHHAEQSAEIAETVMKRMKYDNDTIETVKLLVYYHDSELVAVPKNVKNWLNKIGLENFELLLKIREADIKANNSKYLNRLEKIQKVRTILVEVLEHKECFSLKDLEINGKDLMELGIPQGKEIGKILEYCMERVLENNTLNHRARLLEFVKERFIDGVMNFVCSPMTLDELKGIKKIEERLK